MAKSRFPGKALKLNSRKRVKFRFQTEINADEERIVQIKSGLVLFNQLFGESDEDDDFDGFGSCLLTSHPKLRNAKKENETQSKREETVSCDLGAKPHDPVKENDCYLSHAPPSLPLASPPPPHLSPPPALSPSPSPPPSPPLINGLNGEVTAQKTVILVQAKDSKLEPEEKEACHASGTNFENLRNSKKLVKDSTERTSRKFVLPMVSARSSRIIKPNKRLFSDFTSLCSPNQQAEETKHDGIDNKTENLIDSSQKATNKVKHVDPDVENHENESDDPVCRSIMFYTDSLTEEFKGQVGRPPKRPLRKGETQSREEFSTSVSSNISPSKDPKEDKVKEKIEKLLRSPWDDRIKQNSKVSGKEKDRTSITLPFSNATISKSILRKARLNLNKQTLQKIRSPASVQRLVPLSEEETAESKCGLCQSNSCNTICRYGVSCCEMCHHSINYFTEGLPSNLECLGGQGECQLVGLSVEERCMSCWLSRILLTCAMPSLLHDRLRKCLPSNLKDKIPTSLGRSFNVNAILPEDVPVVPVFPSDSGAGGFGSLVDLPGGWKRKNGNEVLVISPSGEKFRSISKLEEYLKRQGINAQASVLFGNLNSKAIPNSDSKTGLKQISSKPLNKMNNVVVTTLPGGWTRRIKWRNTGDRFDTYVCSPDGRTFRSRQELSSYFQHIGKVDDIHKYFPVKNSSASCSHSSENSEASSTEPVSSSEACSEESTDEKSLHDSDSEYKEIANNNRQMQIKDEKLNQTDQISVVSQNGVPSPLTVDNSLNESSEMTDRSESVVISNFTDQKSASECEQSERRILLSLQESDSPSIELPIVSEEKSKTSPNPSESESRDDIGGVNLNIFSRLSRKRHKKSKTRDPTDRDCRNEEDPKEGKIVLKINKKSLKPLEMDGVKDPSIIKRKKRKKKKKRKHERQSLEVEYQKEKVLPCEINPSLVCDVDKISPRVTEQSKQLPCSPEKSKVNSFFHVDLSTVPCHPNDTWQTLIVPGIPDAHKEFKTKDVTRDKPLITTPAAEVTNSTTVKDSPSELLEESCIPQEPFNPLTKMKKPQKLSGFTTQHFGKGWGRKIKWNEKGQGKVSFLTSPDGQKIVSSIELLAYFKKAGKPILDMDYYFPKDLVRDLPKEVEVPVNGQSSNDEALQRLSPTLTVKEKIEERRKERKVLYGQPKGKFSKRALKCQPFLPANRVRVKGLQEADHSATGIEMDTGLQSGGETHHGLEVGPRVKHVCRSQAQVLGMPRAVFPSPESEKPPLKKKIFPRKKSKFLSVATPKGKRVLKKTIWCNKCAGCTTPNCKVCINCRDMKKYGGPGTKKKPCIKRKCFNPTKAVKDVDANTISAEAPTEEIEEHKKSLADRSCVTEVSEPSVIPNSTPTTNSLLDPESDLDAISDMAVDSTEEKKNLDPEDEEDSLLNNVENEKSIFVPRMMKPSVETKDKGDIRSGKECIPGTRVNIDYWQAYDAEEMLTSGFPIITSVPLQIDSVCFRCGSAGLEQLLFCIWCCEGIHPFCLEEGEGPDNDEEEALWVCKRCAVCHVCGGSGHYDLMQCSGCKKHYHMECLGPTSHISCQPSQDGVWVAEPLHLLSFSWPQQTPIIDVSEFCASDSTNGPESVVLLEELERLQPSQKHRLGDCEGKEMRWETCLLPNPEKPPVLTMSFPDKKRELLVESVCIEDTFADLEEEDHICLEDAFNDLEEPPVSTLSMKEGEVVYFIRDWLSSVGRVSQSEKERDVVGMEDDEYLSLKYKKILPFDQCPIETSLLDILQVVNAELFDVLGYMSWSELYEKDLVNQDDFRSSPLDMKSETSNGDSSESLVDLDFLIQIRRAEVQQVIKDLQELRIQEEKRFKEIEREKSRKKRLESGKEICNNDKDTLKRRKKLKFRRSSHQLPFQTPNKNLVDQNFVEYECDAHLGENASINRWQPQSWEEFDALFNAARAASNVPCITNNGKLSVEAGCDPLPGAPHQGILKRKRGRPRIRDLPEQRKAKRLKLANCSVKIARIELRKLKKKSPKKAGSPLKKSVIKSPMKTVPSRNNSIFEGDTPGNHNLSPENIREDVNKIEEGEEVERPGIKIELAAPQNIEVEKELILHALPLSTCTEKLKLMIDEEEEELNRLLQQVNDSSTFFPSTAREDNERKYICNSSIQAHQSVGEEHIQSHQSLREEHIPHQASLSTGYQKEERSSTRLRKSSYGRASELASLRKAMLDLN